MPPVHSRPAKIQSSAIYWCHIMCLKGSFFEKNFEWSCCYLCIHIYLLQYFSIFSREKKWRRKNIIKLFMILHRCQFTLHSRPKYKKVQFTGTILFASKAKIKGCFFSNELPLVHTYYLLQYFSI